MNLAYYVVDAFATKVFEGNPAAVFILPEWLPENLMQKIAIENNLSETAFAVKETDSYSLRWFTPDREIDLCGHATLATAFVLFHYYEPQRTSIVFQTKYSGQLRVTKEGELLSLDFPAIRPEKTAILPVYEEAIGAKINEAYLARDLFFVLDNETQIQQLTPNFSFIKTFEQGVGVIVTAPGETVDFVSRTFFPKLTIDEDPVCGSAHSNLIPYWSSRLNKTQMTAKQLSARGGFLECTLADERVIIGGKGVLYAKGTCFL